LRLATEILDRARGLHGTVALQATLERLRGGALLDAANLREGRRALEESLHLARLANAPYEIALSIEAMRLSGEVDGQAATQIAQESAAILKRLGIVRLTDSSLSRTEEV
jgi:hypothetical protein